MFSFFLPPSYFVQMKKTPVTEENGEDNELSPGDTPKKVGKQIENDWKYIDSNKKHFH